MAYSLAQTLVLARVLTGAELAAAVAAIAISLYTLPVNQAVSRASFLELRGLAVGGGAPVHRPELAATFQASQGLMAAVALAAPALLAHTTGEYLGLAGFLIFSLFTNIWSYEIQFTMLALDQAIPFERITLVRRVAAYITLAWLLWARDFAAFGVVIAVQTVAAHVWALWFLRAHGDPLGRPVGLTRPLVGAHLRRLWVSVQSTLGEWVTLNAPYAVFTVHFGVGPALIALDAAMKVLRIVLGVVRSLCEIVLPGVSRALLEGDTRRATARILPVMGVCLLTAVIIGAAVLFQEQRVFSLLLGPNNVVPHGAGAPIAAALAAGVFFQVSSLLIGYFGAPRAVRNFTAVAFAAGLGMALFVLGGQATMIPAFWSVVAALTVSAFTASWAAWRRFGAV